MGNIMAGLAGIREGLEGGFSDFSDPGRMFPGILYIRAVK
jgi:hypothetical protein